jgi:hypothetical protein
MNPRKQPALRALLLSVAACGCAAAVWWARPLQSPEKSGPAEIDASKYASLQAAFDALPEGGGIVRLPPGEFEVRRPLVMTRGDTRIQGAGPATHLINRNEQGQPALIIRHSNRPQQRGRIWRVELSGFRVSGNPKSGDGILADGVNEIYIHDLWVDHNGSHGVSLTDCYEDPRISNSILTYNGKAGLSILESHDIVVSANQFEENQDGVRSIDSYNLCMTGNNLDDHLRHGVVIERTCCSVVSGNMIEEGKGIGIVVDRDSYALTIGSNVLISNFGGGVDLRDAWGVAVSANTLSLMPQPALRVGSGSGRIAVTGNNFSNSFTGEGSRRKESFEMPPRGTSSYATGILLEGASDVAITGNLFAGLVEEAVKTKDGCRRIALAGNVSADLGRRRSGKLPAFDLSGADEVVEGHNVFESGFEPSRAR